MKLRVFAFSGLLAACALTSCDRIPGTDANFARTALSTGLIDPESARIKVSYATPRAVCGAVNAKNRMGAYVGDAAFIAIRNIGIVKLFTEAPSISDYREWEGDYKEARGAEVADKISQGCAFPKEWAYYCDAASAKFIPRNDEFCRAWETSNITKLDEMSGR